MPDSPAFFDDSSGLLGLDHSASYKSGGIAAWKAQQDAEAEERLRSLGIACDEHGNPQVQHIVPDNAGAHDTLATLINAGWHWQDALDALDEFHAAATSMEQTEDEDGPAESDSASFFEWCMRAPVSPDKRSSRSRGKKNGGGSTADPLQSEIIKSYGRVA